MSINNKVKKMVGSHKKVEVPLFNSYVFVQLDDVDRAKVFEASGVVSICFG